MQRAKPKTRSAQIVICILLLFSMLCKSSPAAWTGSDEAFVDMVENDNFEYFLWNQGGSNHQFRGAGQHDEQYSYDPLATCAGDGFGIASLVVGAYRGWISDESAYANILALLRSYDTYLARDGNQFFSHFYNFDTGVPQAEYSPIDSTWFICGALLAAQYFKGTEVDAIANRLYGAMNYSSAGPLWSMYFEYTIINIVGAGASNGWDAATAKSAWESCTVASPGFLQGPLFWYQWTQAFVDFRHRLDSLGSNHFDIAVAAYRRQWEKCIALHNADATKYNDYGTNGWGLTSAMASMLDYLEMRPFAGFCTAARNYGGPSIYCSGGATNDVTTDEDACDSGTLVPICLPACMSHVPYEARNAMKHIYDTYDDSYNVYDRYSFKNALNSGAAKSGSSFTWDDNASMDYGCNAVVIENFRSGMPWKYFMSHPSIAQAMINCGFTMPNIAYHDDWNDGSDPNVWTGSTTYANSDGSNPTCTYETIDYYTNWVNGQARRLVTTGSGTGDVVRFELKGVDQSKKDLLSFWLRGENGGEQFDVGLRDAEGHEFRVNIANYVDGGVVSTNWTRVRIPLRSYAVTPSPTTDVRILTLGDFNVRFGAPGTIYVDDLAFVEDDLGPRPPGLGAACIDGRVYLRWGYSADDDVVGYYLWRRPYDPAPFTNISPALLVADHDEIDASIESEWGEDFYYVVQCKDRHGNTGPFSSGEYEQHVLVGRHHDVDWGDGQNPNTFGGTHGRWGDGWGNVWFETRIGWDGKTTWIRHMSGATNDGINFDGVYITLDGGSVASYEALAFWIKQEWGANTLDVGLKSTNYAEVKVPITDYVAVTDDWRYVVIPLADFRGVDFSHMDNISFTFTTHGNVYLDGLRFIRLEPSTNQMFVREAEMAEGFVGGNTNDFKWPASETYCLGNGWGMTAGHEAWWTITSGAEMAEAYLDVRYACDVSGGRTLQVVVAGQPTAEWPALYTGGWGDEASQFHEDTLRLGRITNTTFVLKIRATNDGAAVNLDRVILRSATRYFREAEHWDAQSGSDQADYKAGACGGQVLGSSWGGGDGEYVVYSNIVFLSDVVGAVFRARYGQSWNDGRLITVRLDGTNMGQAAFPWTGGWLDNWSDGGLAELPLGTIPAGTHTLRLEASGWDDDINLDWIRIDESSSDLMEHDTDGDGIPDSAEALYGTSSSLADTDEDGVADLDEISRANGYLTQPTNANTDADLMSDGDELWAGSDPTSATSMFCVASTAVPTNGGMLIRWPSFDSRQYMVLRATNLVPAAGAFSVLASNIDANPPENTYTDAPATLLHFYRVGVQR